MKIYANRQLFLRENFKKFSFWKTFEDFKNYNTLIIDVLLF